MVVPTLYAGAVLAVLIPRFVVAGEISGSPYP
jgi:hypothetical protein